MNATLRLAALALLAAAVGCADHEPSAPSPGTDGGAPPATLAGGPEAQRFERQARRLARALDDPEFRAYVQAQLNGSPVVEHKLHFQRLLSRDNQRMLRAMGAAGGEGESAVRTDATEGITAELYFPVPGDLARWDGGADLLVATALKDRDVPVAFDTRGRRYLLDPSRPPATPVLALVPRETRFGPAIGPENAICGVDDCGGGGNGEGGGGAGGSGGDGTGGPGKTPPILDLHLTRAQFVSDFEGWLKGNPEFELHVLGPAAPDDTSTMVSYQCVGEHAPAGYYWDMNNLNWSGDAKVFTQGQMDALDQAHPGSSYMILALEDDDTACEIKTGQDRYGPVLSALKSAYNAYTGLKDVKVITINGVTRVLVAARSAANLVTAIANAIKSNDDIIGIAMRDSIIGRTSPVGHWAVMEGTSKINGWLNLEMK